MTAGKDIVQLCFIVENLPEAVDHWVDSTGAGPFFVQDNLGVPVKYKGNPSTLDINVGLGQLGKLQIELIEMNDDSPSVYRDMYRKGEAGFHHVAIFSADFDAVVEDYAAKGSPLNTIGEFAGGRFCYIDTRAAIGCITEVYEEAPGMRGLYAAIETAAANWDGKVRTYPLADALR